MPIIEEQDGQTATFLKAISPKQEDEPTPDPVTEDEPAPAEPEPQAEPAQTPEGDPEPSDVPEPDPVFTTFYTDDEPSEPEPSTIIEPQAEPAKVTDKIKYNFKDYVDAHKETLSDYFKYAGLEVENLTNEELVRMKLRADNPSLTKEDIEDELQDTYGIGLKLKEIPEDALDEEIEKIERYNEKVNEALRKGARRLKIDAEPAKRELRERIEGLSLPEIELDVELTTDPSKLIEEYSKKEIEKQVEFRENVWIPSIKDAISKVGGFKQPLVIEVQEGSKVASELTYKLTDKEKEILTEYLSDYQAHPSDAKYVVDEKTGEIDFTRFVSDKAKHLFVDDIIKASVKDALAQFKAQYIKESVVNYSEEPKRVTKDNGQQKDFAIGIFENSAKYYQSNKK